MLSTIGLGPFTPHLHLADAGGPGATWTRMQATSTPLRTLWGSDPDNVLAAGGDGVILRSTDRGVTFLPLASGSHDLIGALAGDAHGDVVALEPDVQKLLYSSDDGATFHAVPIPTVALSDLVPRAKKGQAPAYALAVEPDGAIFLGGGAPNGPTDFVGYLRVSTDRGATFKLVWRGASLIAGLASTATALYAFGDHAALRSTDGGHKWKVVLDGSYGGMQVVESVFDEPGSLDALARDDSGQPAIFSSTDDGGSWFEDDLRPALAGRAATAAWSSGRAVWIVGSAGLLLQSGDGGATFTPVASGTHANLDSIWGSGGDDLYVAAEDGSILHYH